VLCALFSGALVGGNGVGWFAKLDKPRFIVPLWTFYLVELAYYAGGAAVLFASSSTSTTAEVRWPP